MIKNTRPFTIVGAAYPVDSTTRELVQSVRRQVDSIPATTVPMLQRLAELAVLARRAIEEGSLTQLGAMMDEAHIILSRLGLTNSTNDAVQKAAIAAGALGAKVSGAGGGGLVIALVAGDSHASVKAAMQRHQPLAVFSKEFQPT